MKSSLSHRSKRSGASRTPSRTSPSRSPSRTSKKAADWDGYGPKPQKKKKKHKPNNLYDFDPNFFHKKNKDPVLFQLEVDQQDLHHLKEDDIDEISKLEVTYRILKN